MLAVLAQRTYRHLFLAQVVALIGTGLLTVALGLLAYDLAGDAAGQVLGTALAIKMVAYITIAPVVGAFASRLPRRAFLVAMDVVRATIALMLPFVTDVWQVYVLIFLLQSASAAFTPTFQATIPDILPDEETYTKALSLSRLAYDMESLTSPMIAAALLTMISFNGLFAGTSVGFVASALLVVTSGLAVQCEAKSQQGGVFERTTRGIRIYLATPRLVGLLAVTLSAAAAGAMVIVNTVVIVREELGLSQTAYAIALGAYGLGSMLVAVSISSILKLLSDRSALLLASVTLTSSLAVLASLGFTVGLRWPVILIGWFLLGAAYSLSVTPSGRLLRRSSHSEIRPAVFAAQFALSHACWLIAYPLAGCIGTISGQSEALIAMCLLSAAGTVLAFALWPASNTERVEHTHDDLPPDHPHLREGHQQGQPVHPFIIDELHTHWPKAT
jgi:predicted MFS family arabinose efflux permease